MGYIPDSALARLKDYKYKGVDKSLLSNYVLNPFWTWFVTLWPTWVAPNTITLSGLAIVGFNFATMLYYDPEYLTVKGGVEIPSWVYLSWGIGLFAYQTFDAIDGKQARRTGMAGPLGEMFDHGCDAINTTLEVILCSHALNLGRSWWTVASQIATLANFYLTTWEEFHTGVLYLGPFSGPVEGILMISGIYFVSSVKGPAFWDTPFLTFTGLDHIDLLAKYVPNVGINETFMFMAGWGLAFNIISSYTNVYKACREQGKSVLRPLAFLLPFPVSAAAQIAWLGYPSFSGSVIMNSPAFVPFLCGWGLLFAHQVGRMILAHVTKQDFPWTDITWLWAAIGAVDANLPKLIGHAPLIQTTLRRTEELAFATMIVAGITYGRFVVTVIDEITNYLGIACLTVRKKDANGEWQDANPEKIPEKKA